MEMMNNWCVRLARLGFLALACLCSIACCLVDVALVHWSWRSSARGEGKDIL